MSVWKVYSKDGGVERCELHAVEYGGTYMGERAVTATFTSPCEIEFGIFDYIIYRGEKFEIEAIPTVKKVSSFEYIYELRFVSLKYELERCEMRDLVPYDNGVVYPTPLTFSFTGNVRYLTERIQACLDNLYGEGVWNIVVSSDVQSEEKNITITQQNCWNALALVNSTYGLNFHIKGRTITIGDTLPLVDHVFEYGKGNGLYEIERASDTDTGIVTKLRAFGSSRNLDYSYPKRPEWEDSVLPVSFAFSPLRLMLPSFKNDGKTDYILADKDTIAKYGIREASIIYEDIYPSITGATHNGQAIDRIKSVEEVDDNSNTFVIHLYDLGFDLEEHLTTGDAQISMKTGAMQGYTFTMAKIEKDYAVVKSRVADNNQQPVAPDNPIDPDNPDNETEEEKGEFIGYKITLNRISAEGGENYNIPNSNWKMKAGDTFVLLNILMPQKYIRDAESRLETRAREYLEQYAKTNFSYDIGLHDKFLVQNPIVYDSLIEGAKLNVYDEELGIDEEVTIQSITITENAEDNILPQVKVVLNNKPSASTLERIQGKIDSLANETAAGSFATQSEIMAQYRKKLDKPFFDKLFVAVGFDGKEIASTDISTPVAYIKAKYNFATVGGITSFAMGEEVDVPQIYDGLPIDNQTLYWEEVKEEVGTDEEGNPVYKIVKVLKAAGGGTGGGVADSVHWNNIEGKPDFSQYATKDSLSGYLPLSGGTMTGQINMPVGIGKAIKFGEQSRLFAYNGNFYISAEANLVLASGASGNNVPNNAVIDKTGRMFIANNLVVGRSSFITDSYKLNVDGDAYVNGKLVVSGTIYPSISSFHNIGYPSKRFACVYADSVDVGGVKISLLQDGVLLIDGNLAVTGGITSYVDGGNLDLPSIYDGLPIDGDTLYWVLDENGKKVMLKSKGGDEEGGGSVQYPLYWDGFSKGSWDGSEAKTIVLPSKLSDLENDGKFFEDGGWIGSDANSVTFGSYLYGGYSNNTPRNVGQLLAFNNGDTDSWNRGSQIFIEGENFYYRQFWDNYWRNWRRVITGDVDGVIDYDLKVHGNIFINTDNTSAIDVSHRSSSLWNFALTSFNPIMPDGSLEIIEFGKGQSAYNAGSIGFKYFGDSSPNNMMTISLYNADEILNITGHRKVGINTTTPRHDLEVNGQIGVTNGIKLYGAEGDDIEFVVNPNGCIENGIYELTCIRHALRFPWYDEAYEIGTIRSNSEGAWGFGVTYQNNQLVWRVDRERMDVYGDLRIKNGLIQYNEEKGYFYLEGNLVVSGGITSYVDVGNLNLPSIYDGLPLDMDTLGWKEVTDASGSKSKVLSVIGGIDESILWDDIEGKPNWIGSSKPSYSYSEINGTPDLTKYALKENIPSLSGYATQGWVEKQEYAKSSDIPNLDGYATQTWVGEQGYVTSSALSNYLPLSGKIPLDEFVLKGNLRLKIDGSNYHRKLNFGDGDYVYLKEDGDDFLNIYADSGVKIYDNTTDKKEYIEMTRSGITLSTTSSSYISMFGMGVNVNNGFITYNDKDGYWKMEGNLLVTGGITSYSSDGKATPFLINVDKLENITSDSKTQVYTANVVTLLKKQLDTVDTKADASETRISNLKTALEGLSASNVTALVSALKNLNF